MNTPTEVLEHLIANNEGWTAGYRGLAETAREECEGPGTEDIENWIPWDQAVIHLARHAKEDFQDHIEEMTDDPLGGIFSLRGLVDEWLTTVITWAVAEVEWERLAKGWLEDIGWEQPANSSFRKEQP